MTLEKHIEDTMKEWQMKIGSLDSGMRLYYPKCSLCDYMNLSRDIKNEVLQEYIEKYLASHAGHLGEVKISHDSDRFCLYVGKAGCSYVEQNIPEPEFLTRFLEALKIQDMDAILRVFHDYAKQHGTTVCAEKEEDGIGTALYFENEDVEPYVYCVEQNEFGITYHRFAKSDFGSL